MEKPRQGHNFHPGGRLFCDQVQFKKRTRTTSFNHSNKDIRQPKTGQDYITRQLDISIPGYVKDELQKFQHPTPTRPQQSPHQWTSQNQGSTANQLVQLTDGYPALDPYKARNFQQVL